MGLSAKRRGWVLFYPKTRKFSTSYHVTFDEDMGARRCALRDFDLRQTKKADPGATADEEREAKLEWSLYDKSPALKYEDRLGTFAEEEDHRHRGAPDQHVHMARWELAEDRSDQDAESASQDSGAEKAHWPEYSSTSPRTRTNGGDRTTSTPRSDEKGSHRRTTGA